MGHTSKCRKLFKQVSPRYEEGPNTCLRAQGPENFVMDFGTDFPKNKVSEPVRMETL